MKMHTNLIGGLNLAFLAQNPFGEKEREKEKEKENVFQTILRPLVFLRPETPPLLHLLLSHVSALSLSLPLCRKREVF